MRKTIYILRLACENDQLIQQEAGATRNKKGYIDLTTQKSGSIFTTRILRDLSDQYLDLQKKYETLQNSLVKKVVEIAGMSPFFTLLSPFHSSLSSGC
jgi:DNA mismatch repair ATPase MutS